MQERGHVAVSNDPIIVDDVQRTFGKTILISIDLISPRCLAFGVEVGQQWKLDSSNSGPRAVTVQAVDRDAEDTGAAALKLVELLLVQIELLAATRTPIQRIEDQDGGLTAVISETNNLAARILEGEIRSGCAGRERRVARLTFHFGRVAIELGDIGDAQPALAQRR